MKVQITLDDRLMERVDTFADENYMSRSGFVSLACTQYLNQAEATKAIKEMAAIMKKISIKGGIDEETRKQLDDFEVLVKLLSSGT